MATTGQTINDRLNAVRYALAGQGLARTVCKATTEEVLAPKKKHMDYLLACTDEPNVSIPQLANLLIDRSQHTSWAVVFKSLITIHHLMNNSNERLTQYLATSNHSFELKDFMDRTTPQGYNMSTFVRRYAKYINDKISSYKTLAIDVCKIKPGKDNALRTMNMDNLTKTLPVVHTQFDSLLDFDIEPKDLNNGVIMAAFKLLYKDLNRIFAAYQEAIINLIERYFKLSRKKTREALAMYKRYLDRLDKVASFFKVVEQVGLDKSEMPDTSKLTSLLGVLEEHLAQLEAKKRGNTPASPDGGGGHNGDLDEQATGSPNKEQQSGIGEAAAAATSSKDDELESQQRPAPTTSTTTKIEQPNTDETSGSSGSKPAATGQKAPSSGAAATQQPPKKPPPARPSPIVSPKVSPSEPKPAAAPISSTSADKKAPPDRPAKPPSRPPPPAAIASPAKTQAQVNSSAAPPTTADVSGSASATTAAAAEPAAVAAAAFSSAFPTPPPPHPPPPHPHPPAHPPQPRPNAAAAAAAATTTQNQDQHDEGEATTTRGIADAHDNNGSTSLPADGEIDGTLVGAGGSDIANGAGNDDGSSTTLPTCSGGSAEAAETVREASPQEQQVADTNHVTSNSIESNHVEALPIVAAGDNDDNDLPPPPPPPIDEDEFEAAPGAGEGQEEGVEQQQDAAVVDQNHLASAGHNDESSADPESSAASN